jgi:tetratricopeptide (TPR) repeat protein
LPLENLRNGPNFYISGVLLGLAFLEKGLFAEAITELQGTLTTINNSEATALLGYAYAVSGRGAEARKTLEELQEAANQGGVDPALIALIYIGLKETDRALAYLEKAYENRSVWLTLLNISPLFESLRSDPRLTDLLQRIGRVN